MSNPTSQSDDLAALPGFRPTNPEEFQHPDQSLPESVDLGTTSPPWHPPSDTPKGHDARTSSPSSPGSTDQGQVDNIVEEFSEELGSLAGGAFEMLGVGMNKVMARRTRTRSTLWLATDDEIAVFGEAAGRIADRKIPDSLKEGDIGDAIIMGGVIVQYAGRNLAGITREELERGAVPAIAYDQAPPAPSPPTYPGPPTAPAPRSVPEPTVIHTGDIEGVAEPTPPPPDVISPLI